MKNSIIGLSLVIIIGMACKNRNIPEPEINVYDAVVQNPATAGQSLDTAQIPILKFDRMDYSFGMLDAGDSTEFEYKFVNIGRAPLLISHIKPSCSCVSAKAMKSRVEPGDSSVIRVSYHSRDQAGYQAKEITLSANTFPTETILSVNGYINH